MITLDDFVIGDFQVRPERTLFLGHDPGDGGRRLWTHDTRDSLAVIAPPGYGKSAGVIAPNVLTWDGPAIVVTTRADLLRLTGDHRRRLARANGGDIYVYDPLGSEPGAVTIGWSPIHGCANPTIAFKRVEEMTAALAQGVTDASHWRDGAAEILRGYLHAADLARLGIGVVRRWLARQDTAEPAEILRRHPNAAVHWADDLEGIALLGDRERGSFYSVAKQALKATTEPSVLASVDLPGIDIDTFLATKSTLFVVGPVHYQQVMAPMIVGLVDSFVQRAVVLSAASPTERLDPPLLVALDEVANIAPIASLPAMVSEYGGRGITTIWATQTLSRMRVRYGRDEADAILQASTAKLIYGGLSNGDDLRNISSWAGEFREPQTTFYAGDGLDPRMSPQQPGRLVGRDHEGRQHAIGYLYRPALPVQALQQLPRLQAWLWYRSDPPLLVHTPPAGIVPAYQQVTGWTPDPAPVTP